MSRFIQPLPETKGKGKQVKPRELPKAGAYTAENLMGSKPIPTKGGYK
tara:strand:- start:8691 stop:8834 length:144 start_codon:yes stop_codon:yes gene_type:complete